jgi:hypothetical protein
MIQLKATTGEEMLQKGLWPPPHAPLRNGASSWRYPAVVYAYNRRDPLATNRALNFTAALSQMVIKTLVIDHSCFKVLAVTPVRKSGSYAESNDRLGIYVGFTGSPCNRSSFVTSCPDLLNNLRDFILRTIH